MNIHTARGRTGIVAAGHPLATEEAIRVLEAGGNAVDAAVAAGLVLAVVCPYACTLAGDVYMLIRNPATGRIAGLNGTGCAPAAATRERFPDKMATEGVLSASVPGLLAGFQDALERFGTRDLGGLAATALRLATDGFEIFPYFAAQTRQRAELLAKDGEASRIFLPGGRPIEPGVRLVQPELAEIFRVLIAEGITSFYRGEVATRIAEASASLGGLITAADLAAHRSLWQEPLAVPFYGHDVWTMPPNSYGPTLLLQLLSLAEQRIDRIDPASLAFIEAGYQARKRAYKQAAGLIGDPAACEAPMRDLIRTATAGAAGAAGSMPAEARDRCTTNVVVIDRDGRAVSLIESISAPFGGGVVLPGTGILLNNRMAGFNIDPASRNCVAPSKRPAHTLAPCMVTKGDDLVMSIGTPGTVGQTCTLAQFLARTLACGEQPESAIAAPRWSVDFTGRLVVEDDMDASLQAAGIAAEPEAKPMRRGWISFGSIKLAMVGPDGLSGFADDRRAASTKGL
jgi:gamma-glutamyltranspeptidase/glutathione hydrolase